MDKKALSKRDICSKLIKPALQDAGWGLAMQIHEEYDISPGRIIVRGTVVSRGRPRLPRRGRGKVMATSHVRRIVQVTWHGSWGPPRAAAAVLQRSQIPSAFQSPQIRGPSPGR